MPDVKNFVQSFPKPLIPEVNCSKNLSFVIARFRTGHLKGMKISPENASRSYPICRNCPQTQLTPEHLFNYQAILASLLTRDAPPQDILLRLLIWKLLLLKPLVQFNTTHGHKKKTLYISYHFCLGIRELKLWNVILDFCIVMSLIMRIVH